MRMKAENHCKKEWKIVLWSCEVIGEEKGTTLQCPIIWKREYCYKIKHNREKREE